MCAWLNLQQFLNCNVPHVCRPSLHFCLSGSCWDSTPTTLSSLAACLLPLTRYSFLTPLTLVYPALSLTLLLQTLPPAMRCRPLTLPSSLTNCPTISPSPSAPFMNVTSLANAASSNTRPHSTQHVIAAASLYSASTSAAQVGHQTILTD